MPGSSGEGGKGCQTQARRLAVHRLFATFPNPRLIHSPTKILKSRETTMKPSWREQFIKSAVWREARYKPGSSMREFVRGTCDSLEYLLNDYQTSMLAKKFPEEESDLLLTGLRAFMRERLIGWLNWFEIAWEHTESPLERAMLLALAVIGQEYADSVAFHIKSGDGRLSRLGDLPNAESDLIIQPQAQLGERSELDYTIARPGYLTNGPETGRIATAHYFGGEGGSISRADVPRRSSRRSRCTRSRCLRARSPSATSLPTTAAGPARAAQARSPSTGGRSLKDGSRRPRRSSSPPTRPPTWAWMRPPP